MTGMTPLTVLEAVNEILSTIGQSPINNLESALTLDAAVAHKKLYFAVRQVQAEGWNFNKEYNYPLTLDGDGHITIPNNAYTVDVNREFTLDTDPVIRGGKLYDRYNHTYVFSQSVKAEVIFMLPFEDLPEAAKDYAYLIAGRRFQASLVASQILDAFARDDEMKAKVRFLKAHRNVKDNNILGPGGSFMPGDVFKR